jgi:nucleoside-diphosphate-sugar epimerase
MARCESGANLRAETNSHAPRKSVNRMSNLNLITGATGQLGSHIAEQLVERGERVRALVRPASDTTFLHRLGVEQIVGDVHEAASLQRAFEGAEIVYHCAARVSDWGSWSQFERETVTATRNVLHACRGARVGRLLHVSSISVYGRPRSGAPITEDTPLGRRLMWWDWYARAKILAENLVQQSDTPWTIVRPSWMYGPRDRISMPRVVPVLRSGKAPIIGSGDNLLNIIYVGDVAAGAILAANQPRALREAYNLSSRGEVSQRKLVDTLCDALGIPRVTKRVPFFLAWQMAFWSELFAKLLGKKKPPRITRRAIYLIGRPPLFSIAKAHEHLGWEPRVPIEVGVQRTLEWLFEEEKKLQPIT